MTPFEQREHDRVRLLEAFLHEVPFEGWTDRALHAAARHSGLDPVLAPNLFPGGLTELLDLWNELADRRMVLALADRHASGMRTRERVATAVRLRLEQAAMHREAVRAGLNYVANPLHGALAARMLYRTVDTIWRAAGDRSTDFNFYTKRGLLAGVYTATVLYWLNDESPGAADTWAFLDRRIADAMAIPQIVGRVTKIPSFLPNPLRLFRPSVRRPGRLY